jgi:hypothetical protein
MTGKTAIQRIKDLDQERTALFERAKEEALRRANEAREALLPAHFADRMGGNL